MPSKAVQMRTAEYRRRTELIGETRNIKRKPLLCLDFDGVIHKPLAENKSESIINNPPVEGAFEFILDSMRHFRIAVYSSRSANSTGITVMRGWMNHWTKRLSWRLWERLDEIEWPHNKPAAHVSIDDRAIHFDGKFPPMGDLLRFKTWLELEKER